MIGFTDKKEKNVMILKGKTEKGNNFVMIFFNRLKWELFNFHSPTSQNSVTKLAAQHHNFKEPMERIRSKNLTKRQQMKKKQFSFQFKFKIALCFTSRKVISKISNRFVALYMLTNQLAPLIICSGDLNLKCKTKTF